MFILTERHPHMTNITRRQALVGAAALLGLAACGDGSGASTAAGKDTELDLWSYWSKGEAGQKLMQGIIDDFTKQTGIKVNVQWKGRGATKALVPTLNTDNVPADVYDGSVSAFTNQLVAGTLPLTDVYQSTVSGTPKTIDDVVGKSYRTCSATFDDAGNVQAPLSVPYWGSSDAIFFNGKRFPELIDNPPKDWDAFFTILDGLKAKGRRPIALDGSVTSYNAYFFSYFVYSTVGPDGLVKAAVDKTGETWKQPGYLEAAKLVERLAKGKYFIDGFNASKFPAMENKWANDEADFILMGSWLPEEVAAVAAPGFDFQSFPFPAAPGHAVPQVKIQGGSIGIFKKAKHPDAAKQFAAFVLQNKYQQQVTTTLRSLPVAKDVAPPAMFTGMKHQIDADQVNNYRYPTSAQGFETKVLYALDDQLVFGKLTAEQFIDQMASQTSAFWK
ncbi:ABC transporter substrate-binding protein [Dactylosporangium salmoneum]